MDGSIGTTVVGATVRSASGGRAEQSAAGQSERAQRAMQQPQPQPQLQQQMQQQETQQEQQQEQQPRSTSWTAHLREARLSGSTPGLHRTPSAPAEVQDEYDPELPDVGPEEYDPEEPALALSGTRNEEYDPEEPALERLSGSHEEAEYDPAKPATASLEEYDPEKNVDTIALGSPRLNYEESRGTVTLTGTPPGLRALSPHSPEESDDAEESDGDHERGRGRESERDRRHASSQGPTVVPGESQLMRDAASGTTGFNAGNHELHRAGTGNAGSSFGIDAVVRNTAAALDALISTARLSEESWYLWGEAGEARLSMAKQFAHGLLANDLLALLRDANVATEMRWRLTMERGVNQRAASQQQTETPRVPSNQQSRPPGVVAGTRSGARLPGTIRQTPGPGYVCNICGVPGHWIADCPRKAAASTVNPNRRDGGAAGARPQGLAGASRRRPPPDGYVCNACKVPGHWIQQCPKRLTRVTKQAEQADSAVEVAPYEAWMSPALSVMQDDSESASYKAEAKSKDGKRKRTEGHSMNMQKRAAVMAPPPARTTEKGLLLLKMKSLMQQAEVAASSTEKRRLLSEIKALQDGQTQKTVQQTAAKMQQEKAVHENDAAKKQPNVEVATTEIDP